MKTGSTGQQDNDTNADSLTPKREEPGPRASPRNPRPSILFAGPMSLLDITSGAALSVRALLASLAARGYRAVALQAQLFDSEEGSEHVRQAAQGSELQRHAILRAEMMGVEHLMVRTRGRRRLDMRSQ